jgi:hypothetical protein
MLAGRPRGEAKPMKRFLISYTFRLDAEAEAAWHRRVAEFIAAIDGDPDLRGRIRYRCMKVRDSAIYTHLAEAVDDAAIQSLQERAFFKDYTEETRRVAGGQVTVSPVETLAETR